MHLLVHVYVLQLQLPVPQMLPSRYKVALRLGVQVDLEILDSNKYCKNIEGYRVQLYS